MIMTDFFETVRDVPVIRFALLAGIVSSFTYGIVGTFVVSFYLIFATIKAISTNMIKPAFNITLLAITKGRLFCVIHIVSYSPIFKENCTHILCHTYCVIHFFTVSFSVIHQLNSQIFCHTS